MTAVFIPRLHDRSFIIHNNFSYRIEFARRIPMITGQRHRLQPVFANRVLLLRVHMPRFVAIKAVKEEPIWAGNIFYGRHRPILPPFGLLSQQHWRNFMRPILCNYTSIQDATLWFSLWFSFTVSAAISFGSRSPFSTYAIRSPCASYARSISAFGSVSLNISG